MCDDLRLQACSSMEQPLEQHRPAPVNAWLTRWQSDSAGLVAAVCHVRFTTALGVDTQSELVGLTDRARWANASAHRRQ
jgi:hypothetical protein